MQAVAVAISEKSSKKSETRREDAHRSKLEKKGAIFSIQVLSGCDECVISSSCRSTCAQCNLRLQRIKS